MNLIFRYITISLIASFLFLSCSDKNDKTDNLSVILYIVRHGKTVANVENKVQGWSDTPLTEEGKNVAINVGKGLQNINFSAVFSSTSKRAAETAELIINANNQSKIKSISLMNDLKELNFGSFENQTYSFMDKVVKEKTGTRLYDIYKLSIPSLADTIAKCDPEAKAENWETIQTRVKEALNTIAKQTATKEGDNILIVTHSYTISTILQIIDSKQATFDIKNSSVTKILYKNGSFRVLSVNDMQYTQNKNK